MVTWGNKRPNLPLARPALLGHATEQALSVGSATVRAGLVVSIRLRVALDLLAPTLVAGPGHLGSFAGRCGVRQLVLGVGIREVLHGHVVG